MEERILEQAAIARFREHLILEEKSPATVEKYLRDIRAFAVYMRGKVVRKAAVIDYKKLLQKKYAVRSVNSTLASINGLFSFLGWHELRVKTVKLQRQVFFPEEKELTRAEYMRLCRAAEQRGNKRLSLIL